MSQHKNTSIDPVVCRLRDHDWEDKWSADAVSGNVSTLSLYKVCKRCGMKQEIEDGWSTKPTANYVVWTDDKKDVEINYDFLNNDYADNNTNTNSL